MFTLKQTEREAGLFKRKKIKLDIRVPDEEMAAKLGISVADLHGKMDNPDQFTEEERSKMVELLKIDVVENLREAKQLEKTVEGVLDEGVGALEAAMDRIEAAMGRIDGDEDN